jgi:hypothetical protein
MCMVLKGLMVAITKTGHSHHGTSLLSVQQRQFVYLVCLTCCQSLRLLS